MESAHIVLMKKFLNILMLSLIAFFPLSAGSKKAGKQGHGKELMRHLQQKRRGQQRTLKQAREDRAPLSFRIQPNLTVNTTMALVLLTLLTVGAVQATTCSFERIPGKEKDILRANGCDEPHMGGSNIDFRYHCQTSCRDVSLFSFCSKKCSRLDPFRNDPPFERSENTSILLPGVNGGGCRISCLSGPNAQCSLETKDGYPYWWSVENGWWDQLIGNRNVTYVCSDDPRQGPSEMIPPDSPISIEIPNKQPIQIRGKPVPTQNTVIQEMKRESAAIGALALGMLAVLFR